VLIALQVTLQNIRGTEKIEYRKTENKTEKNGKHSYKTKRNGLQS